MPSYLHTENTGKCPCACQSLCTRTKSQSMHLVLLQINTVWKVLLFGAHFSTMNSHTLFSPSRTFFFFASSLPLVFLYSRRQQSLPAVPGDTADLTISAQVSVCLRRCSPVSVGGCEVSCFPAEMELQEEARIRYCYIAFRTHRLGWCFFYVLQPSCKKSSTVAHCCCGSA